MKLSGAVTCVEAIANPVSLARRVMEDTSHCLLAGEGALKFAKKIGFPLLKNPLELATEESHERSRDAEIYLGTAEKYENTSATENNDAVTGQGFDTVGAVALDSNGRLASATSTGIWESQRTTIAFSCIIIGYYHMTYIAPYASLQNCSENLCISNLRSGSIFVSLGETFRRER